MSPIFEVRKSGYKFSTYNERPELDLIELNQTHSNIVLKDPESLSEGDGIILINKTCAAIKTADCIPLALIGKNGAALIHAGWRGLQGKIVFDDQLKELEITDAIVGPFITTPNYEVQEDFIDNFEEMYFSRTDGFILFNMRRVLTMQLKEVFGDIEIEFSNLCTFDEDKLHSYRKDKTTNRNWNILIKED